MTAPSQGPILLVEDKDSLRAMLRLALEGAGHAVLEARDQREAQASLQGERPVLVLTDLRLPEGDGLGVLRVAKEMDPDIPVIVMTAYGGIEDAVVAMKEGALDFLAKPVDPEHLNLMVARAIAQRRLTLEHRLLKEEVALKRGAPEIVGDDPALLKALRSLERAASSDATVLLEGESGSGKELFAHRLHALSGRASGPFVAINSAAIPETLLESELFGHEKGAFTGAVARKPGKFELAHKGTLFLDEIGDLPLALQAKLLRVIENRRFERVGGTAVIQVDVRIVAATNKTLRAAVAARMFREDLFFRLSVFPVVVPPLRERPSDISRLASYFVARSCRELKRPTLRLSSEALDVLQAYPWPGNVRELQNCLERATILTDGDQIQPRHLSLVPVAARGAAEADPWERIDLSGTLAEVSRRILAEAERRKIAQAVRQAGGDKGRAAELLSLPLRMLQTKIKDLGLEA